MEELLAIAEEMDDSPPDANEMAAAPGPVHMGATQARDRRLFLSSDVTLCQFARGIINMMTNFGALMVMLTGHHQTEDAKELRLLVRC